MTYRGRIQNGVVVLEGSPALEEGTVVRVEAEESPAKSPPPGSPQAILNNPARWHGDPEEMDRLLAELRESKQDELRRRLAEEE
jgi:hypothetical protein